MSNLVSDACPNALRLHVSWPGTVLLHNIYFTLYIVLYLGHAALLGSRLAPHALLDAEGNARDGR